MMVTTLDGWVEIFHKATNACKVDYQPSQNCNVSASLAASSSSSLALEGMLLATGL